MTTAKAMTNNIVNDSGTRRTIFKILISLLIVLSLSYVYLIGSITFNVLARKSLENTVHVVGSHVGELELTYLSISNSIDQGYALSHGFVDAHDPLFATRIDAPRVAMR